MKIISWNVNGIRSVMSKGFTDFLVKEKPDILLLQEIKISDRSRAEEQLDFKDYDECWHPAKRPGYSGTAILISKKMDFKNMNYSSKIGVKKFDDEGRVQTLELKNFYLINTYFPHINHEFTRFVFKLEFNKVFFKYIKKLKKKKPVIIGGDYNVAHEEIDLANPKTNIGNPGFTDEERQWMTDFLNSGFVDTYRHFYKNNKQFTWWTYRFNARARNIGWRIDYFCASKKLIYKIKSAYILDKILGSDHCPVGIEIL